MLAQEDDGSSKQTMDPILQLDVGAGRVALGSVFGETEDKASSKRKSSSAVVSGISALCFLSSNSSNVRSTTNNNNNNNNNDNNNSTNNDNNNNNNEYCGNTDQPGFPGRQSSTISGLDDDDSDDESLELRCEALKSSNHYPEDRHGYDHGLGGTSTIPSSSRWLGTALSNGEVLLWDLHQQRVVQTLIPLEERRAAALCMERLDDRGNSFVLHTRDGIISRHHVHDESSSSLSSSSPSPSSSCTTRTDRFEATLSATFCAAAVCFGDANLIAAPDTVGAVVRDWRQAPQQSAAHTIALNRNADGSVASRGFVTSLAMLKHHSATLVACGMEDGSIQLQDLRYGPAGLLDCKEADISIGKDPVLSMDIRPSYKDPSATAIIAAGMAGNVPDLASLDDTKQGRGVIVKVSNLNDVGPLDRVQACIRARICAWKQPHQQLQQHVAVTTEEHWYKANRAGVSVCRFDATGEVVALGGWDYRLRLYRRSSTGTNGQALALLRGHESSISAMDWAPGSCSLLVTGATDGTVLVWDYPRRSSTGSSRKH